jgi:hypothetical protein
MAAESTGPINAAAACTFTHQRTQSSLKHDVAVTHTRFRATGADFEKSGPDGNDISLTNVPNTRIRFR